MKSRSKKKPLSQRSQKGLVGQPPKELDEVAILAMAHAQSTCAEISAYFGCAPSLIETKYNWLLQRGYEEGKRSLRAKMLEVALKGNVTMLIWLSKQYLGMRDSFPEEAPQTVFNIVTNEMPVAEVIEVKQIESEA